MNREDVITFITQPAKLDQSTLEDIGALMDSFPWFQTAHLLKVKNLHNVNSLDFNDALKYSSAFIGDRAVLYHLIHDEQELAAEEGGEASLDVEEQIAEKEPGLAEEGAETEKNAGLDEEEQVTEKNAGLDEEEQVTEKNAGLDEEEPIKDESLAEPEERPADETATTPLAEEESDSTIHTFTGWFDHLPDSTSETGEQPPGETELIDTFIRNQPRIERNKEELPEQEDISEEYVQTSDQFMTETLAKIYISQGKLAKAIFVYEKLSLKYPEKSSYFAAQIRKISHQIDE